jgi:hypothetical protein
MINSRPPDGSRETSARSAALVVPQCEPPAGIPDHAACTGPAAPAAPAVPGVPAAPAVPPRPGAVGVHKAPLPADICNPEYGCKSCYRPLPGWVMGHRVHLRDTPISSYQQPRAELPDWAGVHRAEGHPAGTIAAQRCRWPSRWAYRTGQCLAGTASPPGNAAHAPARPRHTFQRINHGPDPAGHPRGRSGCNSSYLVPLGVRQRVADTVRIVLLLCISSAEVVVLHKFSERTRA